MTNASYSEINWDVNEKITMRYILNGLKEDRDWAPFRSALKMFNKVKEPEDIDSRTGCWTMKGSTVQKRNNATRRAGTSPRLAVFHPVMPTRRVVTGLKHMARHRVTHPAG